MGEENQGILEQQLFKCYWFEPHEGSGKLRRGCLKGGDMVHKADCSGSFASSPVPAWLGPAPRPLSSG